MDLIGKHYETTDDYWRVRGFFRRMHADGRRPIGVWDLCMFDHWRWHTLENVWERSPRELRFWEDARGQIVAVLIYGDPGVCHPMVDPQIASEELLVEMIETVEAEFQGTYQGRKVLFPWADLEDERLHRVLQSRGYEHHVSGHATDSTGWLDLRGTPAPAKLPEGYILRSMGGAEEYPARSLASWRIFHPGEPDEGADPDGAWYRNVQRAPLYRRDLDVVAVEERTGDIVAFATCFFDDVLRMGNILFSGAAKPHPLDDLERAVVMETLMRLHHLGAVGATMSWFASDPGHVYESAGFEVVARARAWRKAFD